jgi:hypothetical protein
MFGNKIKYLIHSLIISFLVSFIYVCNRHNEGISPLDYDGISEYKSLLLYNAFVCILSFVFSLLILYILNFFKSKFNANYFLFAPYLILVFLILLFLKSKDINDNILEFFDLGLSSILFCLILSSALIISKNDKKW